MDRFQQLLRQAGKFLFLVLFPCLVFAAPPEMPPAPVEAIQVTQKTFQPTVILSANLRAEEQISIRSEMMGIIRELPQPEGGAVKKGDVIVQLDNAQQKAELDQQRAAYELALLEFDRSQKLHEQGTTSQREFDQRYSTLRQSQAAMALAKARLDKMQLLAPFDGKLGIYQFSLGQVIQVGDLVTYLVNNQSLRVEFYIPQQYAQTVQAGQKIVVNPPSQPEVMLEGTIQAIESRFDPTTHLQKGYALLDNAKGMLTAGMALPVEVYLPARDTILIPLSAVSEKGLMATVYVIDKDNKVAIKSIQIHDRAHAEVEVTAGLTPGEWVIIAGQHKLFPGQAVVTPTPVAVPTESQKPTPEVAP